MIVCNDYWNITSLTMFKESRIERSIETSRVILTGECVGTICDPLAKPLDKGIEEEVGVLWNLPPPSSPKTQE